MRRLDQIAGAPRRAREEELDSARKRTEALPEAARILAHRFEVEGSPSGRIFGSAYLTKANIAVEGQPLDCCSAILRGYRSPFDATVTERLREAGATCLGSTNMDEFAMGSSGETSILGAPEHPWLPGRVCGGSSSGAAAAVAAGVVHYALGSDTGGSVRQPAACCGLVGFKPTWGRVSRSGLVAHASSLDTIGVIAPRVTDVAAVFAAIQGPDGRDATLSAWPGATAPVLPARVVVPTIDGELSPVLERNLGEVAARIRAGGVPVQEITLPSLGAALGAYVVIAAAEAASNLARYDGSLYGARREGATYEDTVRATRSSGFGDEVKLRILLGTEVLRQGHQARAISRARTVARRLAQEFAALVPPDAACLMPTMPDVAFALGSRIDDPVAMRSADRFTVVASLIGAPAAAVPSGEDADAAPLSLQCIAHRGRDDLALGAAALIEELAGVETLRERSWIPRIGGRPCDR